jgi:hypothetical protein
MSNAGKAEVPAIDTNSVVQKKVTTINADLDAIAEQGHNAVSRHDRGYKRLGLRDFVYSII